MTRSGRGRISAPPFSRQEVVATAEALAERFLFHFWKDVTVTSIVGINFDVVYDHLIYPEYEIALIEDEDLGVDEDGEKILGKYDALTNTAYIDHSLRKDPRRVFTCWHEVGGHGILQGDWLRRQLRQIPDGIVITTESMLSMETVNVLERQANLFAAHSGIPSCLLALAILDIFEPTSPIEYHGPGQYTFTVNQRSVRRDVKDFGHFAWTLASFLQHRFGGISVESISYRLLQTPLVRIADSSRFELRRTAKEPNAFVFPTSVDTNMAMPTFSFSG